MQLAFFIQRRKALRKTPRCIRGITIVKAGGDLSHSRLKGAISPDEILGPRLPHGKEQHGTFLEIDPREGFSVRNFQIQACKIARLSDIIIYADDETDRAEVVQLARRIARAQQAQRSECRDGDPPVFGTFVVSDSFRVFETKHPSMIAIDRHGDLTEHVSDFFHRERLEMCDMSAPSEIAPNVFLGPTPDWLANPPSSLPPEKPDFDVYIETSDLAQLPDSRSLHAMRDLLYDGDHEGPMQMEFPSSGSIMPPTWSHAEVDGLMDMCSWIHSVATPDPSEGDLSSSIDSSGDTRMTSSSDSDTAAEAPKKVLIHCTDGYTESTLLGLTYFMYAHALPAHEAWVQLHRERKRNFFAYPSDVALLTAIQPRILDESPASSCSPLSTSCIQLEPAWLSKIDGSLPSRILPYMYLGNLGHANNPELLKELGISRVLSVGEPVNWSEAVRKEWGEDKLVYIDQVQDNGVDSLTCDFSRCLSFIGKLPCHLPNLRCRVLTNYVEQGKLEKTATLVHCRVGVSRSATICIAEVMNEMGLSFPRAYCFVRARRLNVIIQPHLRFTYELLKWEEYQRIRRGEPLRRELEWATVCREIALMNKPYSRQ